MNRFHVANVTAEEFRENYEPLHEPLVIDVSVWHRIDVNCPSGTLRIVSILVSPQQPSFFPSHDMHARGYLYTYGGKGHRTNIIGLAVLSAYQSTTIF